MPTNTLDHYGTTFSSLCPEILDIDFLSQPRRLDRQRSVHSTAQEVITFTRHHVSLPSTWGEDTYTQRPYARRSPPLLCVRRSRSSGSRTRTTKSGSP